MHRNMITVGLLVGALVIGACGGDEAKKDETVRNSSGEVVEAGEVGALRLKVGDCLLDEAIGEVTTVPLVPCGEPHDSEVYHAFDLTGSEYPGDEEVARISGETCLAEFDSYIGLGYADSIYDIGTIAPTPLTWKGVNDREVLCLVYLVDGTPATGSAKGVGL